MAKRQLVKRVPEFGFTVWKSPNIRSLGHWSSARKEIVLSTKQESQIDEETTLVHELLHLANDRVFGAQYKTKKLHHKQIYAISTVLVPLLAMVGRYRGISKAEVRARLKEARAALRK